MAKPLSDLLTRILPHVPQCTEPLAEQHLVDATIRFFDDSCIKNVTLAAIDVVADQPLYTLPPPTGYRIKFPRAVHISGQIVKPVTEEQLDTEWPELARSIEMKWGDSSSSDFSTTPVEDWRTGVSALPGFYLNPTPGQIRLIGIPVANIDDALVANVVVVPTLEVVEIDDWIFDAYYTALVDATLASLKVIRNKPWTDPVDARIREDRYTDKMGEAKSAAKRSHQRNDKPTRRVRACR